MSAATHITINCDHCGTERVFEVWIQYTGVRSMRAALKREGWIRATGRLDLCPPCSRTRRR